MTAAKCFPLGIKNRWLYRVRDSEGQRYFSEYQIERTKKMGGRIFYISRNTQTNQPNTFSHLYITMASTGMSTYRIITTSNRLSAIVDYGNFRKLPVNLPANLTPGRSWDSKVNAMIYVTGSIKPYRLHGGISKTETITVPAGVFQTLRVTTSIDYQGHRSQTTAWYAPGVGQVKFSNQAGKLTHEYELQGVTVSGRTAGTFETSTG